MIRDNKAVGFTGTENYEIVLYLSRILSKLGKKVLIADYSRSGALEECIPVPEGLYAEDDIISYFGLDYTRKELNHEWIAAYDNILINFGFDYREKEASLCDHMIYACDQQKQNLNLLSGLKDDTISKDLTKYLVIKDYVSGKINRQYIAECISKGIQEENIYVFNLDAIDKRYKLQVQYDTVFEFKKLTKEVKNFLFQMVKALYPDASYKYVKESFRLAERGQ